MQRGMRIVRIVYDDNCFARFDVVDAAFAAADVVVVDDADDADYYGDLPNDAV
jgi:hypothetical protein